MKLLYPILLMGSFASTASDMTIAGLTFASPVLTPECAKEKDAWRRISYVTSSSRTCWRDMVVLGPKTVRAEILFGIQEKPSLISGMMQVYLRDGMLVAASFYTHGNSTQDYDLKMLIGKYGQPTSKTVERVQNRLGTTFDSISAAWDLPEMAVAFSGTFDTLDHGRVSITTPQGIDAVRAHGKQMDEFLSRNKL